ncbi:MAG: hypothetical protein WD357_08695 [Gracilimonas sp.]
MLNKNTILFIFGILLLTGCSYDFPSSAEITEVELGDFNPEVYSIIGSSVSAGLMNGALYEEGQAYAYPNQIAEILYENEGQEYYHTFDINSENGLNYYNFSNEQNNPGRYYLSFRNATDEWAAMRTKAGEEISIFSEDLSEISNFSIPGLKITDIDNNQSLQGNEYYDRLSELDSNESLLDLAISRNPTFFIMEPGTEDIFDYAIGGAEGDPNPDPNNVSSNDLTPALLFENEMDDIAERILTESPADIFLINIPDPFKMPYFTILPWYYINEEWDVVSSEFSFNYYYEFNIDVQYHNNTVNNFEDRRSTIVFDVDGGSPFRAKVIEDEDLIEAQNEDGEDIPKFRQMTEDDFFLYNAEKIHTNSFGNLPVFGTEDPISDRFIITKSEAEIINERRRAFNESMQNLANSNSRIHMVDLNALIERIYDEKVSIDGVTYSLIFDNRTIISADGISLNPKGQALLGNEVIKIINASFNANVPMLNVNAKQGTEFTIDF